MYTDFAYNGIIMFASVCKENEVSWIQTVFTGRKAALDQFLLTLPALKLLIMLSL